MVTMFEMQVAQGADTLTPGYYHVEDWDARILVIPQANPGDVHPLSCYTVVLLNEQGVALAQCSWVAAETEKMAEPIRIFRDADVVAEDEPSYQLVRFVRASQC